MIGFHGVNLPVSLSIETYMVRCSTIINGQEKMARLYATLYDHFCFLAWRFSRHSSDIGKFAASTALLISFGDRKLAVAVGKGRWRRPAEAL
jgi:hypothetical protein